MPAHLRQLLPELQAMLNERRGGVEEHIRHVQTIKPRAVSRVWRIVLNCNNS